MKIHEEILAITKRIEALEPRLDQATKQLQSDTPLDQSLIFFRFLKDAYDELDNARKMIYHVIDHLDKVVIPERLEMAGAVDGYRVRLTDEVGYNFRRATKYSAKTLDKQKLFDWLREQGHGEIITETVNASTLASFLKDLVLNEGIDPPEGTAELTTYYGVGMNRYTPKKGQ